MLAGTKAELRVTQVRLKPGSSAADFVPIRADAASVAAAMRTRFVAGSDGCLAQLPMAVVPGSVFDIGFNQDLSDGVLPVVSLDGIPLWAERKSSRMLRVHIPSDNWLRAESSRQLLRVECADGATQARYAVRVTSKTRPVITGVLPARGAIGQRIVVTGKGLRNGKVLLNGLPADAESVTDDEIVLRPLSGILMTSNYNLRLQNGDGRSARTSEPVLVTVDVPYEQMPHLVNAAFSPHKLHVGDVLKVTMTVRNNLPIDARLTTNPSPGFTYDETEAYYEMGRTDTPNYLHLRVSTDFFVGGHHPGSWPWMFGFSKNVLKPGETATVTGYVRLKTPGTHMFRIGLVCGGSRFIDDNAYQTKIEVLP